MSEFTVVNLIKRTDEFRDSWDRFVETHPKGTIFHHRRMVEAFRRTTQSKPTALASVDADGQICALLTSVRIQSLPHPLGQISSRAVAYCEPLCGVNQTDPTPLADVVRRHNQMMRKKVVFSEVRPIWPRGVEHPVLRSCGYKYLDYLNFVVDLKKPVDQLWRALSKSCRSSIRRSKKHGVQVHDATSPDQVDVLYRLLETSYARSKVPLVEKELFVAAMELLQPIGAVKLTITRYKDRPVAAGILLVYRGLAYAWYGGSERLRGIAPFDCLTWHEIKWARENGLRVYDFGGAGWADEDYGPHDFKAKFGGRLVHYGRYRKVPSRWKMQLAKSAFALGRGLISPSK